MDYRHDLLEWRREKTGDSYDAIADRSELSKNTVWLIIGGKTNPTASSINMISTAMGLNPKYVLDPDLKPTQFWRAVVVTAR